MKKLVIASVAAIAMTGVASAQVFFDEDDGADLTLTLNGTVDEICGLTAATDEATIEFGELASTATNAWVQRGFEFGMVCNNAGGAQLSATSANGGYMIREGSTGGEGNQVRYDANIGTGSRDIGATVGTPPKALTGGGISYDIVGSAALRSGVPVGVNFRAFGVEGPTFQGAPTTTVFAGDYTDVVTISLTTD